MRYALLADIHGNLEALNAVLEHLSSQRIDRYLCIGDIVGYGADPCACLEQVQKKDSSCVAGNHDWACIGKADTDFFNESAKKAVLWTREQLSFGELDELRRMPLIKNEGPVTIVHGTLIHPENFDYMFDTAQALDTARACRSQICAVAHTHVPFLFEYDLQKRSCSRMVVEPDGLKKVKLDKDGSSYKYVVNPGSVGQPRDGDRRASFAVLDDEGVFSIHRIEYDIERAKKKIIDAGLPEFLAERLSFGR